MKIKEGLILVFLAGNCILSAGGDVKVAIDAEKVLQEARTWNAEKAEQIEVYLKNTPDDPLQRSILAAYYFASVHKDQSLRLKKNQNILWMIEHYPQLAILRDPAFRINPLLEGKENYRKGCELWDTHLKKNPSNAVIIANAASYFLDSEREKAERYYLKARELRFNSDVSRVCMLIKITNKSDISAYDVIQNLFPDKSKDFIININETDIVLVKALPNTNCPEEILKAAHTIENSLAEEMGIKCVIGISTNARHLRELADRYKEAQVAIEVGRVFESEKTIINYETLGLGRIIYQLPTTLCEMFLNEVFKKNPIETLDEDTLETINKFFENNLNVSETSRKLYVHRNTLVYRLEKIKKITGLDLREFDHAIVFKVAMMVKMYLDSLNNSKF